MSSKKILSSVYESSKNILTSMVGIRTSLLKIEPVSLKTPSEEYCVLSKIFGILNCVVVMSFDKKTGLDLASRLTGKTCEEEFSDESGNSLCELVNIILGNAMNILDHPGFNGSISPPTLTKGRIIGLFMPEASMVNMISLDIEVGTLKMFISSNT